MSSWSEDGGEGVIGRKMLFCPNLQEFETDELITTCENCEDFFVYCCYCSHHYEDAEKPCHHYRLVFTDGACSQNGRIEATAGIGIAYGKGAASQQAIPITGAMDQGKKTSQRAELLAAIFGLQFMAEADRLYEPKKKNRKKLNPSDPGKSWVIATDSEYVVKGMTEWLPAWRNNNFHTNRGTKPANLDLFLRLDAALTAQETKQDVKIGFWHVPRFYNTIADGLAKEAARVGDPA